MVVLGGGMRRGYCRMDIEGGLTAQDLLEAPEPSVEELEVAEAGVVVIGLSLKKTAERRIDTFGRWEARSVDLPFAVSGRG